MKNQYFGDIGDYGKYGLLRFLADHGINIAVNWYLTPDDPSSHDGQKRSYLNNEKDRIFDPILYDCLRERCACGKQDVHSFEAAHMISNAVFYSKALPSAEPASERFDRTAARERWHRDALNACSSAELVFLDPDIGLKSGKPSASKDADKYAYATEICDYYDRGQDVVYYSHRGRRTDEQWKAARSIMNEYRPDAALFCLTYHRGTQRSFVFMIHQEHFSKYRIIINGFLATAWKKDFTGE